MTETELLHLINEGFSDEFYTRYEDLLDKQDDDTITSDESNELISLNDRLELHQAERLKSVGELARLRNVSFDVMMQSLGIQPRQRRHE